MTKAEMHTLTVISINAKQAVPYVLFFVSEYNVQCI